MCSCRFSFALSTSVFFALTVSASAQREDFFRAFSRVELAARERVQTELKLTDGQKKITEEIVQTSSEDIRKMYEATRGGDLDARRHRREKILTDASTKLTKKLDDVQKKRLMEIFIQVNGPIAVFDKDVRKALNVTEGQQKDLTEAREQNSRAYPFRGFGDMSDEEKREAFREFVNLRKEAEERLLEVLSEEQREKLAKMKGNEFEINMLARRRTR